MFAESDAPLGGTLKLNYGYALPRNAVFTVSCTDTTQTFVEYDTTYAVSGGSTVSTFGFKAKDGPADVTFTFTEPNLYPDGVSARVLITNVPPQLLYPSRDPENPTEIQALAGAPFPFSAIAYIVDVSRGAARRGISRLHRQPQFRLPRNRPSGHSPLRGADSRSL